MTLQALFGDAPLAITETGLAMVENLARQHAAGTLSAAPRRPANTATSTSVAVVPILGAITSRPTWLSSFMGWSNVASLSASIQAAVTSSSVDAILLDIDSPGGGVYGIQELAAQIRQAATIKPVIAVANHMAASAAYWLGCAGSSFYAAQSGEVGSIGVVAMHVDYSAQLAQEGLAVTYVHAGRYKVEGNPSQPLSDEARQFIQHRVDEYGQAFVADVAKYRNVPTATVLEQFGQGRVFSAAEATSRRMIDGVCAGLQDAVTRGSGNRGYGAAGLRRPMTAKAQRLLAEADIAQALSLAQGGKPPKDRAAEAAEAIRRATRRAAK